MSFARANQEAASWTRANMDTMAWIDLVFARRRLAAEDAAAASDMVSEGSPTAKDTDHDEDAQG